MAPQITYNPDTDIPDLTGKVFFITGGTAGIGKGTILNLAKHNPAHIHFTGRNSKRADSVIAEVNTLSPATRIIFSECDHTSLASVNATANEFLSKNPARLDVLICNAGVMGGPPALTQDGYEIQFGINFLSHALLTKRFLPILQKTAEEQGEARIINLSSDGYTLHTKPIDFPSLKTTCADMGIYGWFGQWARYGQSKFAQVIYTAELSKRYPKIMSVVIHPGVVHTGLVMDLPYWDRWFVKLTTWGKKIGIEEGPLNSCWAATTKREDVRGDVVYYPVGVPVERSVAARDEGAWGKLWEWVEGELEGFC